VAGGDREEGARVVDEAGAAVEAGRLGHGGAKAQDRVGGVEEPPGCPDVHARVEAGERRDLAREGRLVHREEDEMEIGVLAVALEQRAQLLHVARRQRNVVPGVGAEASERVA
jgi:hypothetical protein